MTETQPGQSRSLLPGGAAPVLRERGERIATVRIMSPSAQWVRVDGAVAILTGAAAGLGHAIAMELADAGMRLAIIDVQGDKLNQLAATLASAGAEVLPIEVDLASAAATQESAESALAHFRTPRVLIHNAAILRETSVEEITFERWREEVDVILQAAFILSRAVWPAMVRARSGSIVVLSVVKYRDRAGAGCSSSRRGTGGARAGPRPAAAGCPRRRWGRCRYPARRGRAGPRPSWSRRCGPPPPRGW